MNIINASWEMVNIGTSCQEVIFEQNDTLDELTECINSLTADYQVLKIPVAKSDFLYTIPKFGYIFIETQIKLQTKINSSPKLPDIYKRFEPYIDYHKANYPEIKETMDKIKSGKMFLTDRVTLDPYFNEKMAGNRYAMWINEMIERGSNLYIATYKNSNVGMCININKRDYFDGFLGGIFPEYINKGLGFLPLYINLLSAFDNGARLMRTSVSSNNLPIFRLHEFFGFETIELLYTYILHKGN